MATIIGASTDSFRYCSKFWRW